MLQCLVTGGICYGLLGVWHCCSVWSQEGSVMDCSVSGIAAVSGHRWDLLWIARCLTLLQCLVTSRICYGLLGVWHCCSVWSQVGSVMDCSVSGIAAVSGHRWDLLWIAWGLALLQCLVTGRICYGLLGVWHCCSVWSQVGPVMDCSVSGIAAVSGHR